MAKLSCDLLSMYSVTFTKSHSGRNDVHYIQIINSSCKITPYIHHSKVNYMYRTSLQAVNVHIVDRYQVRLLARSVDGCTLYNLQTHDQLKRCGVFQSGGTKISIGGGGIIRGQRPSTFYNGMLRFVIYIAKFRESTRCHPHTLD